MKRAVVLALLLLSNFPPAAAQGFDYVGRHLTMDDGLSTNIVNGILQDHHGFIWLASDNGLQRYDGSRFTNYFHRYDDSASIISNRLYWMQEDSLGRLWAASSEGINVLDPRTDKSFPIRIDDEGADGVNDIVNFMRDGRNRMWILTRSRLYSYDFARERPVLRKILQPSSADERLWAWCYDPLRNWIWLNVHFEIVAYDIATGKVYTHNEMPAVVPRLPPHEIPNWMALDPRGDLWAGTMHWELFRYSFAQQKVFSYYVRPAVPDENGFASITNGLLADKVGNTWIGSNTAGLLRYLPGPDSFEYHTRQDWNRHSMLADNWTNALNIDREGNIWVASRSANGITVFNPGQAVTNLRYDRNVPERYPQEGAATSTFQCRNGKILVGGWTMGICVYDSTLGRYHAIRHVPGVPTSLGHDFSSVICFAEQKSTGKVWVGCQHASLSLFDPATETCVNYNRIPELGNRVIGSLFELNDSTLYLGVWGLPMVRMNTRSGKFTVVSALAARTGRPTGTVSAFHRDRRGQLWLCTSNSGLCRYDPQSETTTRAYYPGSPGGTLPDADITCLYEAGDTLFLLGTKSSGIVFFNPATGHFSVLDARAGLPSNSIMGISADARGNYLVASLSSLCRVEARTHTVTVFGTNNGVVISDFINGFTHLADGRVVVPAWKGVVAFRPERLYADGPPYTPVITGLHALNEDIAAAGYAQGGELALGYPQNTISIRYASLTYAQQGELRYRYRLAGIDKEWVDAGTKTEAAYTNLPGGHYTFEVCCLNSEGMVCQRTAVLRLAIGAPFWRRWWFYALCTALVVMAAYAWYRYRLRQALRMERMRSRIASDLHDEVGSTLTGISITSQLLLKMNEPAADTELLKSISNNSRQILESMSDIVWSIQPAKDHLGDLLSRMRLFAGELLDSQDVSVRLTFPESLPKLSLPMEQRRALYLIYKEALHNIVKYADAREVEISLSLAARSLLMRVRDDGRGFSGAGSAGFGGNGIGNMRQRAEAVGARLTIESAPGSGTCVTLLMPLPTS